MARASTSSDQAQLNQTKQALAAIQQRLATSNGKAVVIQSQVKALTAQIKALDGQVSVETQAVNGLKADIESDNTRITQLQSDYSAAQAQANTRARSIYMGGPASSLTGLLTAHSFGEFVVKTQIWEVGAQLDSKVMIRSARVKQGLQTERQALSEAKAALDAKLGALSARGRLLNNAQAQQATALAAVQVDIGQELKNERELAQASQNLTAALQADALLSRAAAQASANVIRPPAGSAEPTLRVALPIAAGAASASGLIWPVRGPLTSPFGPRPSLGDYHYGIDIGASTGTPIYAPKAGVIAAVGCGSGYGICTIIDHGGGLTTLYAHQSRSAVSAGQQVGQGQEIGLVGCTGLCYGPHLHFEVRIDGIPHNPIQYLPG